MLLWLAVVIFPSALLASAQVVNPRAKAGASPLVLPRPGAPLSLEQIEERSRNAGEGASNVEVIDSEVYRDSEGRLRITTKTTDSSGGSASIRTILVDPVAGSTVLLVDAAKTAYRMPGAKGDAVMGGRVIADEELPPSIKWTVSTEDTDNQNIEGIVFHGTRITQAANGNPALKYTVERWYSDDLKLTGAEVATGPNGKHTARVKDVHMGEPDPALFVVPADYKVVELKLP